jgi:hypothetical protein
MGMISEKKSLSVANNKEPEVILMHTYCLHVSTQQRELIKDKLDPKHTAIVCENDSDVCYIILPALQVEVFLAGLAALNIFYKKVSISELREKYASGSNYSFLGNPGLNSHLLLPT